MTLDAPARRSAKRVAAAGRSTACALEQKVTDLLDSGMRDPARIKAACWPYAVAPAYITQRLEGLTA